MNLHDLLERARKTFVQAFLASFAVPAVATGDVNTWRAAAVAAAAAAVSATWNKVLGPFAARRWAALRVRYGF